MQYSKQSQEQMAKAQGYAAEIEIILRSIFNCERYGFGGQVNSDAVRKHPFLSMTQGLAFIYAASKGKRESIDKFINDFSFYSDYSLDELLSFDAKKNPTEYGTIELQKNNGLEEVEYIISSFKRAIQ